MTPTGRRRAVIGMAVLISFVLGPVAPRAWSAPSPTETRPTVALVLVRDLTWTTAPAVLDGFARASLSMRTADVGSVAADTYVSLGKGGRANGLGTEEGVGRVERLPDGSLRLLEWGRLQDRDRKLHVGGALGSVGEELRRAGRRWALVGDDTDAAAAAATGDGTVPATFPGSAEGISRALESQLDALFVTVLGAELPRVLEALGRQCALVVSASTPAGSRHLGVVAASPPCGLGTAGLRSTSTRHDLATLPDVSRAFLRLAGVGSPESIAGGTLAPAASVSRADLVDRDRRAWTADRSRTPFVWLFVVLNAFGALAAVLWRRCRLSVGCALMAIPAASLLMMLVPWWRVGAGMGLVVGGLMAAVIAVGAALVARRHPALGIGALATLTAAVVGVDALFASPLQVDAPFGNSPVVAGRFFGMGNIGSGLLVGGILVAGGLAIDRWGRAAVPWVGAAMVAGVVAGAAPPFGADVGGVLFAVPAYGLLLLGIRRERITARHVVLLAGAAVATVALFTVFDVAREAGSQTHLAQRVGDGGLGDDIIRKGSQAIKTVKAPMAIIVVIAAAALAAARFSPGRRSILRFASYAVVVAAVLGSVLNDSGLNVAGAVLAVAWPAGVALAPVPEDDDSRPAATEVLAA